MSDSTAIWEIISIFTISFVILTPLLCWILPQRFCWISPQRTPIA